MINKIRQLDTTKKAKIIFWTLIVIGIFIRIYKFPLALQEMNCDEIMTAVNAKSILATGRELGGIRFPVYLQGWGGQSVVLLYLMTIAMGIFGNTLFAVRLPMLIISIISLFVFYDLLKKLTSNTKIALIGLALVVISPWHILQSIWSLDCNMFPHFLLFAIDLLYTGIIKHKNHYYYLAMLCFALSLYCYGVAIYFVPLFLIIMSIYLIKIKKLALKQLLICMAIFIIIALPIITMFAINALKLGTSIELGFITIPYYESLSRTKDMIFFTPNFFGQLLDNIKATLTVLFLQNDGAEWNASPLFGTTYHITLFFTIIGIISCFNKIRKNKKDFTNVMLMTWLGTSLLTGLIINQTNINRLNSIWYVLFIFGAIGIYTIYEKIHQYSHRYSSIESPTSPIMKEPRLQKFYQYSVTALYAALFLTFSVYFYSHYTHVVDNSGCFSRGFYQALNYTNTVDKSVVLYDNVKNDGNLPLYIDFNNNSEKNYHAITDKAALQTSIDTLGDDEALIIDLETNQYDNLKNYQQFGDFVVVTK